MALPSGAYAPRDPAASVLYQVVRDHYETFRVEAARLRGGEGLLRFVQEEFEAFLRCGWLAGGFARFRCTRCRAERLVAFSCKGRGFCPSCGGRRMTERAARLVDHVWPDAPVRQWVLSLPPRVRYALAWRHDLCSAVAGVFFRAVQRHLRAWAQTRGLGPARSGAVIVVQRFGGALNLNVHFHALVLDGVFVRACDGGLRFHRAPAPTEADVADVLATILPGLQARLARHGLADDDGAGADGSAEAAPGLAGLAAASRACWRSAASPDGGRSGWATRVVVRRTARPRRRAPTCRTRGGRGSTCTRASPCLATGRGSSACLGTCCARR
jgi:hypothetical protein